MFPTLLPTITRHRSPFVQEVLEAAAGRKQVKGFNQDSKSLESYQVLCNHPEEEKVPVQVPAF